MSSIISYEQAKEPFFSCCAVRNLSPHTTTYYGTRLLAFEREVSLKQVDYL